MSVCHIQSSQNYSAAGHLIFNRSKVGSITFVNSCCGVYMYFCRLSDTLSYTYCAVFGPTLYTFVQARIQEEVGGGGGVVVGLDPPPLWGGPNTSKRVKNVVRMCANAARFST